MTDPREQIAEVLKAHQAPEDEGALCGCGFDFSPEDAPTWAEHVADAVVEALGLTEEAERIDALIEASSLGTPEAKAARDSVSDEEAQRIVDRANQVGRVVGGEQ